MHDVSPESAAALLTIDLGAIVKNYQLIRTLAHGARTAAVVKANAYGLGAHHVVPVLAEAGCRDFFVAHLMEAEALADLMPDDARLYILNGLMVGAEPRCAAIGAVPVLNSLDQIGRWRSEAMRLGRRLPGVVQVDSGMARLGLSPEDVAQLGSNPHLLDGIDVLLVMSHLACADELLSDASAHQQNVFQTLTASLPAAPRALANSAGAFLGDDYRYDLLRPGIALYGGAPHIGAPNPMHPVVTLETRIVQVRDVPAGAGIGYGLTGAADRPRRIAVIPVGYADGWPRCLSNKGAAYIGDHRVPICGRVSMDSMLIDVTDVPAAMAGADAVVELLGPHQTIDDVAQDAETISYEILTQLGARYARIWLPPAQDRADRRDAA